MGVPGPPALNGIWREGGEAGGGLKREAGPGQPIAYRRGAGGHFPLFGGWSRFKPSQSNPPPGGVTTLKQLYGPRVGGVGRGVGVVREEVGPLRGDHTPESLNHPQRRAKEDSTAFLRQNGLRDRFRRPENKFTARTFLTTSEDRLCDCREEWAGWTAKVLWFFGTPSNSPGNPESQKSLDPFLRPSRAELFHDRRA